VYLLDILRVLGIDQCAQGSQDITGPDLLFGQRIGALAVDDHGRVLVLIDHLHLHEALAGVGQSNGDGVCIEVEDCG